MWNMLWPVALVVLANTFYNICSKSTPGEANVFLSLTVTYLVAAVLSLLAFCLGGHGGLQGELKHLNWTSVVLGMAIVGLEFGFLSMYRAGWKVSVGHLVTSSCLAVVLLLVGALLYRETITLKQLLGTLICLVGLIFLNQ